MTDLRLSLAISDYEHARDLVHGVVKANGIDLVSQVFQVEEIFFRFTGHREWDLAELSMAKYVNFRSAEMPLVTAIPVFPSRVFRQSSLYVRDDSPLTRAEDLAGKKVGIPEWAQTAGVYAGGWLMHQVGIPLRDIEWVQGGVNEPGRVEKIDLKLPDGVVYRSVPDRSLTEMLLAGDIDAIMTAHSPTPFERGEDTIRQLLPDWHALEEAYFRETGIFPIMHVIAIRQETFEANPWIAMNLLTAFETAKRRSMDRALTFTASRFPIPWGFLHAARSKELFGEDPFPYGIEDNRTTLEAYLKYAHEQRISDRLLSVDELFPEEVRGRFRI